MLSLWLPRLSTDRSPGRARSRRQRRSSSTASAAMPSLIVALDDASRALGLPSACRWRKRARCIPPSTRSPEDTASRCRSARTHRRLVPALHAAGRLRSAGRPAARHQPAARIFTAASALITDLCGALEAAGFAQIASRSPARSARPGPPRATAEPGSLSQWRRTPAARAAAARRPAHCRGDGRRCARARRPEAHRRHHRPATRTSDRPLRRRPAAPARPRARPSSMNRSTPRLPVAPYVAEQRFAEPIAREEDVLAITERLAARLATRAGAAR